MPSAVEESAGASEQASSSESDVGKEEAAGAALGLNHSYQVQDLSRRKCGVSLEIPCSLSAGTSLAADGSSWGKRAGDGGRCRCLAGGREDAPRDAEALQAESEYNVEAGVWSEEAFFAPEKRVSHRESSRFPTSFISGACVLFFSSNNRFVSFPMGKSVWLRSCAAPAPGC